MGLMVYLDNAATTMRKPQEVVICGAPLHGCGALEHVPVAAPRGRAALEAASPM